MGGDELFQKQPAEQPREHAHRQEEARPAGYPPLAVQGNAAARNDHVDMRMVGEPLGLALGLLSWSILLALASIGGVSDKLFSLSAIAADVRLLVVIPLFFLCESSLDPRLRDFVSTIVRSGVVPSNALPTLESEIARIVRWKDAWLPEAMCLLAAMILSLFAAQLHLSGKTAALDSTRSLSDVPFAGLWYWIVCLPLFRFLMFRWIWRIALWCRLLWRLAKLDLHLVPIHPDGAAGLGYLEIVQTHFTALVLRELNSCLEPLVGRLASVDRAADGESGARVINPGHGPLSRLSKSSAAAA